MQPPSDNTTKTFLQQPLPCFSLQCLTRDLCPVFTHETLNESLTECLKFTIAMFDKVIFNRQTGQLHNRPQVVKRCITSPVFSPRLSLEAFPLTIEVTPDKLSFGTVIASYHVRNFQQAIYLGRTGTMPPFSSYPTIT